MKDLKVTERLKLEFRGEFLNAFNHAQFVGGVDGLINDGPGSFGGAFSVQAPRIGEIAVKILF
jgi:hypothetical protein